MDLETDKWADDIRYFVLMFGAIKVGYKACSPLSLHIETTMV